MTRNCWFSCCVLGIVVRSTADPKIMRSEGPVACQPRPLRVTTEADRHPVTVPDLLQCDCMAAAPGEKFVGDITYIHTREGFVYLATVIDCYLKEGCRVVDR